MAVKLKRRRGEREGTSPMEVQDFDEFVRRQQQSASEAASVDWNKERDEWLDYLAKLYTKIESLLRKYVSSGQIQLEYRSVELNEENIGTYTAKQMLLRIGPQSVVLEPIGTLLIGSKGRLDIVGPSGKAQILLVDSQVSDPRSLFDVRVSIIGAGKRPSPSLPKRPREIQWEWKIVTRPPERRFIEITQQSLFRLIMEVANG